MPDKPTIHRVVLNFTSSCNMACPFCYIPFDETLVCKEKVMEVARAIVDYRPLSITIGGGDPFMYPFIAELVEFFHPRIPYIQVDTNAKSMARRHLDLVKERIDLIGLPLDGSNSAIHDAMRHDKNHFQVVKRWLNTLSSEEIDIKVNTVVSAINVDDLSNMARMLRQYELYRWSLYQFWPLERGQENDDIYALDTAIYTEAVTEIVHGFPEIEIETAAIQDRSPTYFFVNHHGTVYTVDSKQKYQYVFLGNILEPTIIDRWLEHADPGKQYARIVGRMSATQSRIPLIRNT